MLKRIFGLCLLLLSTQVWSLTPVRVVLDWYINPDHAPLLIAQAKGYFKQQGLDVSLVPPGSVDPSVLVATGQADIAISYHPYLLMDVDQGMPIVRFASLIAQPLSCVTVLQSSGVVELSQLKGKTVAYSGSSLNTAILTSMLKTTGVNLSQLRLVNVNMDLTQALISRRVDAAVDMMRNVEPVQMRLMGYPTHLFLPENNGIPSYDELLFITNRQKAHDPMLAKFIKAITQATADIKKNPEATWDIAKKAYPDELAPSDNMENINHHIWSATVPYLDDQPQALDKSRYQRFAQYLYQQELIKQQLPVSDYAQGLPSPYPSPKLGEGT